jgi:hypothetical protein
MSGRVHPATASSPPSDPPTASQRCAAACEDRTRRSPPGRRGRPWCPAARDSRTRGPGRPATAVGWRRAGDAAVPAGNGRSRSRCAARTAPGGPCRPCRGGSRPSRRRGPRRPPAGRGSPLRGRRVSVISRMIASSRLSRRSGPLHAASSARSWVSDSGSTVFASSLGGASRISWSGPVSPSAASHAENRRTASWRERAVAASPPASSRSATQALTTGGSQKIVRRGRCFPAPPEEPADPVAVGLDGLGAFRSARRCSRNESSSACRSPISRLTPAC